MRVTVRPCNATVSVHTNNISSVVLELSFSWQNAGWYAPWQSLTALWSTLSCFPRQQFIVDFVRFYYHWLCPNVFLRFWYVYFSYFLFVLSLQNSRIVPYRMHCFTKWVVGLLTLTPSTDMLLLPNNEHRTQNTEHRSLMNTLAAYKLNRWICKQL